MKKKNNFNLSERKFLLRFFDILIIISFTWLAVMFLDFKYITFNNDATNTWLILLSFYYLLFGEIFQLYSLNVSNNRFLIVKSVVLTAFATTIFYVFTPFFSPELPENRLQILSFFSILFFPVLVWRYLYMSIIFSPKYFKTVVFIGKSDSIKKVLLSVKDDAYHHIDSYVSDKEIEGVKGFKDINSINLNNLINNNYHTEVIVCNNGLSQTLIDTINKELILLFKQGVNIVSYESFYEEITSRVPKEYLDKNFYKHINFSKNNTNRFYLFGLRTTDILISIIGLFLFSLLIPFCFIGNLIANRGPLFYFQDRVGQNGSIFRIYKLRSMVTNAETNGAVWALKNDTRITSFGKFLRKTRLDELPQFLNILKGDMSLIGPRPERPEFVDSLEEKIPFYSIRHVVRPGLTGWAQVNYPYANTIEEQEIKLRYDLYYIKERSAFLDFKIYIKTITTVLYFKGQ